MSAEKITIYRTLEDKSGVVQQLPTTVSSQVYDEVSGQTVAEQLAHIEGIVISLDAFPRLGNEVDDTERIDRATTFIKTHGGGTLNIPTGLFVARYIKLKNRVFISGVGRNTILKQADGVNTNLIDLETARTKHFGIFNLSIDGNKQNNANGHGIHINSESWRENELYPDTHGFINNVHIYNCANNGLNVVGSTRELQINELTSFKNGGHGCSLGGSDNNITNSIFYWNEKSGFVCSGANIRFTSLKCFGNKDHGYYAASSKRTVGAVLECQENGKHGLFLEWVSDLSITGIDVDANGFESGLEQPNNLNGVMCYRSQEFYLQGFATNYHVDSNPSAKKTQCYGVRIGEHCDNYHVDFTCKHQHIDYLLEISSRGRGMLKINHKTITDKEPFYETGTFIPSLIDSTATYTTQSGHYTRYGNRVEFDIYLVVDQIGTSTVSIALGNLPFYRDSASNDSRYILNCHVEGQNTQQEYVAVVNSNQVQLRNPNLSWAPYSNLKNSTKIRVNGSYRIDN